MISGYSETNRVEIWSEDNPVWVPGPAYPLAYNYEGEALLSPAEDKLFFFGGVTPNGVDSVIYSFAWDASIPGKSHPGSSREFPGSQAINQSVSLSDWKWTELSATLPVRRSYFAIVEIPYELATNCAVPTSPTGITTKLLFEVAFIFTLCHNQLLELKQWIQTWTLAVLECLRNKD